jgi:AraC-like DNA-binding protein
MSEGYSAAETANMLNFSSPNYFSTFFKRMTGKPPASFIKNSSKGDFV